MDNSRKIIITLAIATFSISPVRAQVAVARQAAPVELAQNTPNTEPLPTVPLPTNTAAPASPMPQAEEKPLSVNLSQLKGVVVLGSYQDFKPEGVGAIQGVDVEGPAFLKAHKADVSQLLVPYMNKPLTRSALDRMQVDFIRLSRRLDRPVVDVYYPEQEIIGGVVQMVVYEGKVNRVEAIHLRTNWFSDSFLTNHIHLKPGDSISQQKLLLDLDRLNRDPQFLEVNVVYKQAQFNETNSAGSTDIDLVAKERFPLRFFAGYDDYGLKVLGENRIFGGLNYGKLFGVEDQLNYQYTTDIALDHLRSQTGSFIDPLPWGHTLMIYGGYTQVRADLSQIGLTGLANSGQAYQGSVRYSVPLPHWGGLIHDVSVGYDFKSADTALEFGKLTAHSFLADVDQAALGYRAYLRDLAGYSQITLNGYYSPGGLLGHNEDSNYATFHPGLKANYYYGRIDAERTLNLPWKFWLRARGGYQDSSTGLLPSEQLYLGGETLARGYPEDVESGDEGWYGSAELHSPLIQTSNLTRQKNLPGQPRDGDLLDIFGFFDHAYDRPVAPNTGDKVTLDSVGVGLNYHVSQNLIVNFAYGFQLQRLPTDVPEPLRKDRSRIEVSATLAF